MAGPGQRHQSIIGTRAQTRSLPTRGSSFFTLSSHVLHTYVNNQNYACHAQRLRPSATFPQHTLPPGTTTSSTSCKLLCLQSYYVSTPPRWSVDFLCSNAAKLAEILTTTRTASESSSLFSFCKYIDRMQYNFPDIHLTKSNHLAKFPFELAWI